MKHNVQLLTGLDVQPMLDLLKKNKDMWNDITIRQDYPGSAHADTECIFIRGPLKFTAKDYFDDCSAAPYPAASVFQEAFRPLMEPLTEAIGLTQLGRVLIVKLKPGGHVKAHVDEGKYADMYSRFHIVLATNDKCTNTTGGEVSHWPVGTAWWFDHKQEHTADNGGQTNRIHIIVDAVSTRFPMPGALRVN